MDSLKEFRSYLVEVGAVPFDEPIAISTGKNIRFHHPDGSVMEYVEFKK